MTRHLHLFATAAVFAVVAPILTAQTPAPGLTKEQKEAAAAIQAPQTSAPPPVPGQLQGSKPAVVAPVNAPEAAKPATPPPTPPQAPAANSASKMQLLDAVTQKPAVTIAPTASTTTDKLPVTSSTSTSRQFIVHGKVFETRSAMSSRCEEIAQQLRKVLNDKEPWIIPIVVLLNTGEEAAKSKGPPVATTVSELTHGGFHLQVTLNERPGLTNADLRKEVVRALLAERIVRNHKQITTPEGRLLLPDWILTGVLHAMDYKADARPSVMFASIFRSGKIYGIEEIIAASPVAMDGLSRTIYETSCCALVLALIDQPNGPQHFNKFLNSLCADPRTERQLLDVAFPNFAASASSLNKWWSLQLAALSKPGVSEPLAAAESLKAIEEALLIRYEAKGDEVPKNVKMRPFIIPAPLVVASSEPKAQASTGEAKPKSSATKAEEESESSEKPKRSLWRRLLFLSEPEEAIASKSKEDDKPAETVEKEKTADEGEEKPGFFARLFSFGGDEKKPTDKEEAAKVEKPKVSTPKDKPEEPAEEDRPSLLNPLNWFRGDKKPEDDRKETKPAKKEQSAADTPDNSFDVARLLSPALADAWQLLSPAEPRLTVAPARPLFDFRKRDSKDDGKKTESKKATPPKKSASKPAAESKSDAKKDSKPHTTNPNAKPAGKTTPEASGTPKTSNPNSKPVPAGLVKPSAGTPAGAAGTSLVPVVLPLEEFQHILKHPDRVGILNQNISALRALELRVSVLFRPVISAYLAAVLDIQAGKTKDMDKRLATLHEFALVAYQKTIAVRDYLDYYEAENGGYSGKFEDFLNLPATIKKELPPRTDPISKYLDAIDKEFSK